MLERGARAPVCFGRYQSGERICDGRRALEEPSCLFRDRCLGARLAGEDGLLRVERLVRRGRVNVDGLGELVAETIFKYQVREGESHHRAPGKTRLLLSKAPSERHARARASLEHLAAYLFSRIANLSNLQVAPVRRLAQPGDLYLDDLEDEKGYTNFGYRTPNRCNKLVMRIWRRQYASKRLTLDLPWYRSVVERDAPPKALLGLSFKAPPRDSACESRVANVGRIAADAFAEMLSFDILHGRCVGPRRKLKERS